MGDAKPIDRIRSLRVLELSSWLAAPGAAALLADQGAEVIKVEPPGGDPGRNFVAALGGESSNFAPSFALLNRGKQSICLDLGQSDDRERFDELLADADIFITNLRSGSLARLGLEPDEVMERLPRLIFASVTGLGLRGSERDDAAFDVGGFWARSGLMAQLQVPEAPPPSPTGGFGDIITSMAIYAGIMSALYRREQSGRGGLVETSLAQVGAFVMSGDLAVEAVRGNLKGQRLRSQCRTPLVNSYRAACGRWFYLTGIEAERHFPSVARAIGRDDLITDLRFGSARAIRANSADLIAIFDDAFAKATLEEWRHRFVDAVVCWQPIAAPSDVLCDRQLIENNAFRPVWDGTQYTPMVTSPFSIDREKPLPVRAPDPAQPGNFHHWRTKTAASDNARDDIPE